MKVGQMMKIESTSYSEIYHLLHNHQSVAKVSILLISNVNATFKMLFDQTEAW